MACLQKSIESVGKIELKMFSVWHPYRKVRLNFENYEQRNAILKFTKVSEFSMDKSCFSSEWLLHDWSRKVSVKILRYPGPIFIKLINRRLKNWVQTDMTSFHPKFSISFFLDNISLKIWKLDIRKCYTVQAHAAAAHYLWVQWLDCLTIVGIE